MPVGAVTAGLGLAGNIVSGLIGGGAAKSAGNNYNRVGQAAGASMAGATNTATTGINNATSQAQQGVGQAVQGAQGYMSQGLQQGNDTLQNVFNAQAGNLNPYMQTGQQAASNYMQAMGPGGALSGSFNAPTAAQAQATPGYQFQLSEGLKAAQQSAAANGSLQSGGTMKALEQYGQGLASTYYQNAYNNALGQYQTNYSNTLNSLNAGANMGLQGSSMFNQAAMNYGNSTNANLMGAAQYMGNAGMTGAQLQGGFGLQGSTAAGQLGINGMNASNNYYMQGAGGQAAGIMGQGNAYANMAGGAFGNLASGASSFMSAPSSSGWMTPGAGPQMPAGGFR